MPSSRKKPTEDEWLRHKSIIQRLYLVDNVPLKELVGQVGRLGLNVTKSQLEYQLKTKWRFDKNMDKPTWVLVGHQIRKRKREGKESEVIFNGKRLRPSTVNKETNRHCDTSIIAQLAPPSSPPPCTVFETQVTVCTPQALRMELDWPESLPWLQFRSNFSHVFEDFLRQKRPNEKRIEHSQLPLQLSRHGATSCMVPYVGGGKPGLSKLASEIGKFMPESYPGEHLSRASALVRPQSQASIQECFTLMVYDISNKHWDMLNVGDTEQSWLLAVAILRHSGLLHHCFDVAALGDRTIKAFMDNLFCLWLSYEKSVHVNDDDDVAAILQWLLSCGVDPDALGKGAESLRLCINRLSTDCTRMLLKAGALSHVRADDATPLHQALRLCQGQENGVKWEELVSLLIQYSPLAHCTQALGDAIRTGSVGIMTGMLLKGVNLLRDMPAEHTALCRAASIASTIGMESTSCFVRFILDTLAAQNPSRSLSSFITPDVFISAAAAGNIAVLQFLSTISSKMGASNHHGFNALHAAASTLEVDTCEFLLRQRVPIHPPSSPLSALHLAALSGSCEVIDFLIENGADIHAAGNFDIDFDTIPGWERNFSLLAKERLCNSDRIRCVSPLEVLVRSGFSHSPPKLSEPSCRWGGRWSECLVSLVRAGSRLVQGTLTASIRSEDMDLATDVLAAGADPNETWDNISALQWAASSRQSQARAKDVMASLLDSGASLRGDEDILALDVGNRAAVELLQARGMSLRGTTIRGVTALGAAARSKSSKAAETLLGQQPDLYDARLLCHLLWLRAPMPLIGQLLKNRPRDAVADRFEATALSLAVEFDEPRYLHLLLPSLPLISEGPISSHDLGGERSWQKPDTYLHEYESPLAVATRTKKQRAIDQLRSHGHGVDWHTLIEAVKNRDFPTTRTILELQPVPDLLPGQRIRHPLLEAVCTGNLDMVRLLLSAGFRPAGHYFRCNIPPKENRTRFIYTSSLQTAVQLGNLDMIDLLLEAGADVNEHPLFSGATALQCAAVKGYLGIARHLMDLGADVNARRAARFGRTALEGAAEHGRLDIVVLLLCSGAKTAGTWRRQYVRSIRFAEREGNLVVASLLRDHRAWTREDEDMWREDGLLDKERRWSDEDSDLDMSDEGEPTVM